MKSSYLMFLFFSCLFNTLVAQTCRRTVKGTKFPQSTKEIEGCTNGYCYAAYCTKVIIHDCTTDTSVPDKCAIDAADKLAVRECETKWQSYKCEQKKADYLGYTCENCMMAKAIKGDPSNLDFVPTASTAAPSTTQPKSTAESLEIFVPFDVVDFSCNSRSIYLPFVVMMSIIAVMANIGAPIYGGNMLE
ncbi:hypothetical protein niasHT_032518 [Heterodera trifolii]|uniref:Uncharacterized protein n=1 Tax=Heterodera trifolii TaxID=157864 RepID=A0ABD2IFE5_9BILA